MIAADMPAKKPLAVESGVAEPDPEVWFEEGNDVGGLGRICRGSGS
jgi:hypothetical protein